MFKSAESGTGWKIIKLIIAIIAISLGMYELIFAGQMMLFDNDDVGLEINSGSYDSLTEGEAVWGKLDNITAYAECEDLRYYMVFSDSGHILFFRAPIGSKSDIAMQRVMMGNSKEFMFKGYVKPLTSSTSTSLSMYVTMNNTFRNSDIDGSYNDLVIRQVIDTSPYDTYIDVNKVVIASVVAALLMFLIAAVALRKFVKDFAYAIGVRSGRIVPEVPRVDYNPRDVRLEIYSDFEGDRDALSQGYNLRKSEFAPEHINVKEPDAIEYFTDYEKDSIDFTQERKARSLYGEEYTPPTLERNTEIYGGYEYDALDFAHEPVEKKDINEF